MEKSQGYQFKQMYVSAFSLMFVASVLLVMAGCETKPKTSTWQQRYDKSVSLLTSQEMQSCEKFKSIANDTLMIKGVALYTLEQARKNVNSKGYAEPYKSLTPEEKQVQTAIVEDMYAYNIKEGNDAQKIGLMECAEKLKKK